MHPFFIEKITLSDSDKVILFVIINYAFFFVTILITNSVATISAIAIGSTINAFVTNPAIMYETNETAATVNA